jgi:uncharacterized protein YecT (DUF1311 family)
MTLYKILFTCFLSFNFFMTTTAKAMDCNNLQTQVELNHCASSELDLETKKINKTYNKYIKKLNPKQKQQFKEVQLTWIKFKDLTCHFEASSIEGGSAYSMVLVGCLAEKTRQRNKELEALDNCQEGDLSCPAW